MGLVLRDSDPGQDKSWGYLFIPHMLTFHCTNKFHTPFFEQEFLVYKLSTTFYAGLDPDSDLDKNHQSGIRMRITVEKSNFCRSHRLFVIQIFLCISGDNVADNKLEKMRFKKRSLFFCFENIISDHIINNL
jgi:hypothetical protein